MIKITIKKILLKLDRITINPARMNGQPCIRDLRLTVRHVIELLATYSNREELHHEFPELEDEDIQQSLIYASMSLDDIIIAKEAMQSNDPMHAQR